ncbi:hypothetical protein [Pyruvatibacter mobilis]|uniref:hypothetical protein n=1 Tax=Pyruvatibacter mobilis TaxID=1712261 RepID=UPI003C79C07B
MTHERYSELLAARQALVEMGADQIRSYDRAMLAMNSGALALSVVFVSQVVNDSGAKLVLVLILSWSGFVGSIFLNLLSYISSWRDTMKEVEKIDLEILEKKREIRNSFRTLTMVLNGVSFVGFFVGSVLFLIFAVHNIAGDEMEKKIKENVVRTVQVPGKNSTQAGVPTVNQAPRPAAQPPKSGNSGSKK